jgi:hypothetical protein
MLVTVEQDMAFAGALLVAMSEEVKDRDVLRRVQQRATLLMPAPPAPTEVVDGEVSG